MEESFFASSVLGRNKPMDLSESIIKLNVMDYILGPFGNMNAIPLLVIHQHEQASQSKRKIDY